MWEDGDCRVVPQRHESSTATRNPVPTINYTVKCHYKSIYKNFYCRMLCLTSQKTLLWNLLLTIITPIKICVVCGHWPLQTITRCSFFHKEIFASGWIFKITLRVILNWRSVDFICVRLLITTIILNCVIFYTKNVHMYMRRMRCDYMHKTNKSLLMFYNLHLLCITKFLHLKKVVLPQKKESDNFIDEQSS